MAAGERWKYIYSAADDHEYLFDAHIDPQERRNHAGAVPYREQAGKMKAALIEHLRAGGEDDALDGDDFRKYPRKDIPRDPDWGLLFQDAPWADNTIPGYTD